MGIFYSRRKKWKSNGIPQISLKDLDKKGFAQTGDIILFEGTSMFGLLEECCTKSAYSHVAMFVRDPTTNKLYVWESSDPDGIYDYITESTHKDGPKLVDAYGKLIGRGGHNQVGLVYRKLIIPPGEKTRFASDQWPALKNTYMAEESRKNFEYYFGRMVTSYTHMTFVPWKEDPSSRFCSEEIAATWLWAGVPLERFAEFHSPQDFSEENEMLFGDLAKERGWALSTSYEITP
jgi:hypothetical protein